MPHDDVDHQMPLRRPSPVDGSEDHWLELNKQGLTSATIFRDAVDGTSNFDLEASIQRGVSPVKRVTGVDLLPSS
ncbi:hypothetical protein ABT116_48270, partial [Streptomyces sp. NPDC002130]